MAEKKEIVEKEVAKPVGFKLYPTTIDLLKKLSEKSLRSQSKTLEYLINQEAKKEKLIK